MHSNHRSKASEGLMRWLPWYAVGALMMVIALAAVAAVYLRDAPAWLGWLAGGGFLAGAAVTCAARTFALSVPTDAPSSSDSGRIRTAKVADMTVYYVAGEAYADLASAEKAARARQHGNRQALKPIASGQSDGPTDPVE